MKFHLGDKVRVKETSRFKTQRAYGVGKIVKNNHSGVYEYTVDFKNEIGFGYDEIDLEYADISWRAKLSE